MPCSQFTESDQKFVSLFSLIETSWPKFHQIFHRIQLTECHMSNWPKTSSAKTKVCSKKHWRPPYSEILSRIWERLTNQDLLPVEAVCWIPAWRTKHLRLPGISLPQTLPGASNCLNRPISGQTLLTCSQGKHSAVRWNQFKLWVVSKGVSQLFYCKKNRPSQTSF